VPKALETSGARVMPTVIRAYYTQVDKAQYELRNASGTVTPGVATSNNVIVLEAISEESVGW
jgi:hypothetical protein